MSIFNELQQALVKAGSCTTPRECRSESRILFASNGSGLHFEIYEVQEPRAMGVAFEVLGRRGRELPTGKKLEVKFVSHSKRADLDRSVLVKQPVHAKLEVMGSGFAEAR